MLDKIAIKIECHEDKMNVESRLFALGCKYATNRPQANEQNKAK